MLWLLLPLEWLFIAATAIRRWAFKQRLFKTEHPGVPVVIVGNITAGGSGKTPAVLAITQALAQRGLSVAIVSRGYGGKVRGATRVAVDATAAQVGDEALLLARESSVPVYIGHKRAEAAKLAANEGAQLVLCDDGLQHYALSRDVEIVVMDAKAGFGNGHRLPLGPLRESLPRLGNIDFLLQRNGSDSHSAMSVVPVHLSHLVSEEQRSLENPEIGPHIHGVAGIARPERFFASLKALGFTVEEHAFPDHYAYTSVDFEALRDKPIVMTAKDAVKCAGFPLENAWVLTIEATLPDGMIDRLLKLCGLQSVATPNCKAPVEEEK
ncbi:MAG: tetraacyldisaccharide 4'-kinase [Pseudomonadota bacterium]